MKGTKEMFKVYAENWKFKASHYLQNGNNALMIVETVERDAKEFEVEVYCMCSVNPGVLVPENCLAVKDYSENAGMVEFLKAEGIIEGDPVGKIPSGFVEIPVYVLTQKGLDIFKDAVD